MPVVSDYHFHLSTVTLGWIFGHFVADVEVVEVVVEVAKVVVAAVEVVDAAAAVVVEVGEVGVVVVWDVVVVVVAVAVLAVDVVVVVAAVVVVAVVGVEVVVAVVRGGDVMAAAVCFVAPFVGAADCDFAMVLSVLLVALGFYSYSQHLCPLHLVPMVVVDQICDPS